MEPEQVDVDTPAGAMPVWHWPAGHDAPGVVVCQEIFGVGAYIRRRCADLHALGYAVWAPEFYWRLPEPHVDETRDDVLQQAMGLAGQLDWDTTVADGVAAVRHAAAGGRAVGLLGFCFGGGLAFNVAAETPVEALVSYYGSALPDLPDLPGLAARIGCPSLHHFGEADAYIAPEQVDRIRAAVTGTAVPAEFHTYAGAGHAFDNPGPVFHDADAADLAWRRTVDFLDRVLPI